jgi:putative transposase
MTDMKKSRFTEEQIIGFLKQAEAGMPIKELCRNGGFSDATFYKWRAKFGGMQVSEAQRLRELESENAKLKRLLAEAHLDMHALKSVSGGKALAPQARREAIRIMVSEHHLSERRARIARRHGALRVRPGLSGSAAGLASEPGPVQVVQRIEVFVVELVEHVRRTAARDIGAKPNDLLRTTAPFLPGVHQRVVRLLPASQSGCDLPSQVGCERPPSTPADAAAVGTHGPRGCGAWMPLSVKGQCSIGCATAWLM